MPQKGGNLANEQGHRATPPPAPGPGAQPFLVWSRCRVSAEQAGKSHTEVAHGPNLHRREGQCQRWNRPAFSFPLTQLPAFFRLTLQDYSNNDVLNAFCAQPHSISRSLRKKVLPHSPLWKKGRESHGQSPGEKTEELRCDFSTQSPPPELLINPHTHTLPPQPPPI